MSILATGGAGYIGSHTAVELMQAGKDVVIVDDLSNSSVEVVDRIAQIAGRAPKFYRADVADREAMKAVFAQNEIEAVIHLAGLKSVGESVFQPVRYYRNNLDSTLTLLEVMREFGVSKLIFSSSATVYGQSGEAPFDENAPVLGCSNPYGWTKYMIEQILRDAVAADSAMSVVTLRYFNPAGAHPSGLMGEKPSGVPANLMPYIAQVANGEREKLSVFGDDYPTQDGTGVRDYVHVVDLARGHVAALDYAMKNTGLETVNLGSGRGYSVLEMIHAFERVNGVKVPYAIAPRRAGDVAACYAGIEKAASLLGWRPEKSLEEMCRDAWRWQRKLSDG